MIPVTLSKLDNYNGFVGSFDLVNWWKSLPLPGNIECINDVVWVYGQYHVCSAHMMDGTYSILQSCDNGYSWTEVLNTVESINTIIAPDYGVALAATSGGWWKSSNSGTTWSKVSTHAPGCFCVKELNNEVLVAISKRNVWRSTDQGTSWTWVMSTTTDIIYPAIDGTSYDALFGFGGTMYYSDNGGNYWYDFSDHMRHVFPDGTDAIGTITDIELTSIDMTYMNSLFDIFEVPSFVVQFLLPNGNLRHYFIYRTPETDGPLGWDYYTFNGEARFDAKSSVKNSLNATYSRHTGSDFTDKLVVFTGSSTTTNTPILKTSTDGGITWGTVDLKDVALYEGPDLAQISVGANPLLSDAYFTASWGHGCYCHNHYTIYNEYYRMNQSFDLDFKTLITREAPTNIDIDTIVKSVRSKTYTTDVVNMGIHNETYSMDVLNKATVVKSFPMDELLLKSRTNPFLLDVVSVLRFNETISMDELLLRTCDIPLKIDNLIQGTDEVSYSMGINIQESITGDILNNTEYYHTQPFAIGLNYPKRLRRVFDSRKETKT